MSELDSRLAADCHHMGRLGNNLLLLMDNANFPWLILVPDTDKVELHHLPENQQRTIWEQVSQLAQFIESHFSIEKINTAAIGNIVSQLHIHVVGRHSQDLCWPGVVWGCQHKQAYTEDQASHIRQQLAQAVPTFSVIDAS